jgi:thiol-disulfide isomerase/thioredoxin
MIRRMLAVAALLAAAACTSHGSPAAAEKTPHSGAASAERIQLIATANLRPCPKSSPTAVPGGLPNVTLACLGNGPAVHMAGLTGMPTVVNLWGSWCPDCQTEEPYLSSAYDKTHQHVRFLGVDTVDDADSALDFDAHGVTPPVRFPSVSDPDKKVLLGLHFPGPPETLFLDSAGHIVHTNTVPYRSTAAVLADISTYLHVSA